MFVWGDEDPLVPLAFCRHVGEALPDARQVVLNDCGHVPQVELPEDSNGLLLDFIGSAHSPARPGGRAAGAGGAADPRRAPAQRRRRRRLRTGCLEPEHDRRLRPRIGGPMPATGTGAEARTEEERSRNGGDPSRRSPEPRAPGASLLGAVAGPLFQRIQDRLTADLDDRDPDYIRENLPLAWLLSSLWFRGEVRGMGRIPEDRPVLLVGNHSGGNLTPDTLVFTLAFYTYFGVERPLPPARPQPGAASPDRPVPAPLRHRRRLATRTPARRSRPAPRCSSTRAATGRCTARAGSRDRVDFAGRKGFVRLALEAGVPIVPVVSIGGQETALFLSHGERLAKACSASTACSGSRCCRSRSRSPG